MPRVIAIGAADLVNSDEVDKQFEATWKVLVEEGEPRCTFTGFSHSSWPKPAAAIVDVRPRHPRVRAIQN